MGARPQAHQPIGRRSSTRIEPYQGRPALPKVTVATALSLPAGWWAATRGKRGINPRTGKPVEGGSFPLNDLGQCVTAPWYGIKIRPVHVAQGAGASTITALELGALVGFRRDYPWAYIPVRKGARGVRNIAQLIADAVSPFMGAAVSSAVQGEDWYEAAVSTYHATLYRLDDQAADTDHPALPAPRTEDRAIEQLELFPAA